MPPPRLRQSSSQLSPTGQAIVPLHASPTPNPLCDHRHLQPLAAPRSAARARGGASCTAHAVCGWLYDKRRTASGLLVVVGLVHADVVLAGGVGEDVVGLALGHGALVVDDLRVEQAQLSRCHDCQIEGRCSRAQRLQEGHLTTAGSPTRTLLRADRLASDFSSVPARDDGLLPRAAFRTILR